MGEKSSIGWTDSTWNPVIGCSRISEGCQRCYAERLDRRFRMQQEGTEYRPWTPANAHYNVRLKPERLDLPKRWKRPRRIFVNSRSDLFHEEVPTEFVDAVFGVMQREWRHVYQVLTKRPERILPYLRSAGITSLPQHIWIGTSVENARWAEVRIPALLNVPAAVRFLSCEPLLGPVDLTPWAAGPGGISWVIAGGESQPGARPMELEWARSIRDWCAAHRVAFQLKQLGGHPDARSHDKAVLDGVQHVEWPQRSDGP